MLQIRLFYINSKICVVNDYLPGFLPFPALQLGQQTNFSSPTLSEVTMTKMLGHEYQRFLLLLNDLNLENLKNQNRGYSLGFAYEKVFDLFAPDRYIKSTANPHF